MNSISYFTIVYSSKEKLHHPEIEVHDGGIPQTPFEISARCEIILDRFRKYEQELKSSDQPQVQFEILEPQDFGMSPILLVHSSDYIQFLQNAWDEWVSAGGHEVFCHETSKVLLASTYVFNIYYY